MPRLSVLYLPSSTGPTAHHPGYPLPLGTDLAALEQDIIAAMSGRTFLSIEITEIQGGVVLLNGAALAFAVLAPPHA